MVTTRRRQISPAALAVGDAGVIVLWAVLGLARHQEGITLTGLGRNAGFVLIGWFAVALVLKTYARPGVRTFVATWAIGVTLGVVLPWIALRRPLIHEEFVFTLVTLGVTLVLLSSWRGVAWVIGKGSG